MKNLEALKVKIAMFKELNQEFPKNKRFIDQLERYKTFAKKEGLKVD